jgi:hypothetical protein
MDSERTNLSAVIGQVMLQQDSGFRLYFQGSGLQRPRLHQTLIEDETLPEERTGLLGARI